jgi:hypothetical protein
MLKKLLSGLITASLVLVLGAVLMPSPAMAATPQEIQDAIDAGMPWLASQQWSDGSWDGYVGPTGLALLKFETHAMSMDMSPLDPNYVYAANVQKGLDYIFSEAIVYPITSQPAGDPDSNGNGIGIGAWNYETMYECGIATMAVCASGAPDAVTTNGSVNVTGRTYEDVAQDMVDFIAFAQNEGSGGWTYDPNESGEGDNSVSGYVTLGLSYAEASPPYGFDLVIPDFVRTELNNWINYIQNTGGGSNDGGSGYSGPNSYVNILKTGHLLAQMALVGDTQATPRVQRAVAYIARHWNDANTDPGWRNHYQACFTTMKGFQSLGITLIDVDGDLTPETDWYDEMSTMIVNTQNQDGSWPADYWWGQRLASAWAMLTLEKAAPPPIAVGGEAYPINEIGLIAPWIVLAMVIAAGGIYLVRRRAHS